jgi:uncharacterized protein (DUF433 family)
MSDYQKYIDQDPEILVGKPRIKGTRIAVELIVRKLGSGWSIDDLLEDYPHLEKKQIQAALLSAAAMLAHEEILEPA